MTRLPALLVALLPAAAAAADLPPAPQGPAQIELHGRTVFLSPEQSVSGVTDGWQLLQFLEIGGRDLTLPGLSIHAAVWGGGVFDSERKPGAGNAWVGDVNLFYLDYADPRGRYQLRLGRQLILGGAAPGFYGQIDGGYARASTGLVELEAYGGQRVVPPYETQQSNLYGGARVGLRSTGVFTAGLAFTDATTAGRTARRVIGVDATARPLPSVDFVGAVAYDLIDPGLAESRALVRVEPVHRLALTLGVDQGSPGRLVDKASIFSVFSLGDWAEVPVSAEYALTPQWIVRGRYARVFFPTHTGTSGFGDQANSYGAGVTTIPVRSLWLTLDGQRIPADGNGYGSVRLAARWTPEPAWVASADILAFFYDGPPLPPISDTTRSFAATLYAQRRIIDQLSVGVGAEWGSTVFSSSEFRTTLMAVEELDFAPGGAR